MKKVILTLFIAVLSLTSIAQTLQDTVYVGGSRSRSTKVSHLYELYRDYDISFSGKRSSVVWLGFSWGYNGLVGSMKDLHVPSTLGGIEQKFSLSQFTLHLVSVQFIKTSDVFYMQTGLDFEFNNFRFKNGATIQKSEAGGIEVGTVIDPTKTIKTKLSTNYINIPLTLHIRIKDDFGIFGGVVGGACYNGHTKVKYLDDKNRTKTFKDRDLPMQNFRYGYIAGINLSENFAVYGSYYPKSMFKGDQPNVAQVNLGVRVYIK